MSTDGESGLQPERTAMAWQRTALGFAAVSAFLLHHAAGRPLGVAVGTAGLGWAVLLTVMVEVRDRRVRRGLADGDAPMGSGLVRTVMWSVVVLAVAALVTLGSAL